MANLISVATGNLTTALTNWDSVETGTRAVQSSHSASTDTTTSTVFNADAQDLTGTNLNICDGLLMFCKKTTATGTVKVVLSQDSGTTETRTLTVNATDLPLSPSWVFFKFASTLTLDGGTDYAVGIQGSSAGNATFYRDGTAANWTHMLRLVSLATAAAGDVLFIVGEQTGAATETPFTITMDSTATTDYGTGTDGTDVNGIEIGNIGTLQYGTAAATNYYLKLSGSLNVWGDGTLNIGTTGTPIPRGSTAVLEFDPVADGGMGLIANNGSTCNIQGLSRTSGKNIYYCKLNTDEAVDSTSLGVDTDTGWLDNDVIGVAPTGTTITQFEKGTLNGNAGASSLTVDGFGGVGGGLAFAHGGGGIAGVVGEVVLLTRNVVIRSATSTLMAYVYATATSTVDIDWAEFYYIGENATNKRGIEVATTTGSFSMQYSSIHDTEDFGFYIVSASGSNITFSNNVLYNLNSAATGSLAGIFITASTGVAVLDSNFLIGVTGSSCMGFDVRDVGATITNNTVAGIPFNGFDLAEAAVIGTFSGNTAHSITTSGLRLGSNFIGGGTISNCTFWRNNAGINFANVTISITIDSCTFFGNNVTAGIVENADGAMQNTIIKNCTFNGSTTVVQLVGLRSANSIGDIFIIDCSFGVTTAHTTADININSSGRVSRIFLFNTTLASSTEVGSQTNLGETSFISSQKHDASSTTFKNWYKYGTIQQETTTRHTASGYSWKLTPNNASYKLILPGPSKLQTFKTAVNSSSLVTINAYVQKDGSYNGNAPRLVLVGGIVGGIASDVTDSLTVGSGTWEQLTVSGTPNEAGVVEYYVDCDGTAGNVYVDDFSVTQ